MYDFEITKREIIASIAIVAVMFIFGILISGKITEKQADNNEKYNVALKIEDTELFKHGMKTSVGNAFVYGDLEAVDTVTYPEIEGEYIWVEKVEERYERHERTVTKTDSEGNEYTEIEVYYEWDTEDWETKSAKEIKFCNVIFPIEKIDLPRTVHIETIPGDRVYSWESSEYVKVRFVYYGVETKHTGTVFTDLRDNTISDNTDFYKDMNITETYDRLQSSGGEIIFWILWIILTAGLVFGFYYLDNWWLE